MKNEYYDINGCQVTIPIPESYRDCIKLIKSDRYRISGKNESFISILLRSFAPFLSSFLFWFRLSQYKGWLYPFCLMMYARECCRSQIRISLAAKVGYGLSIGHEICMVIGKGTVIGNNVNVSQFLNIGTNYGTPAIIGDCVYIGPNVSIVEDVKIGSFSSIGAGAVVTKDIPENATAAGVPAKVLNYNNPGKFVNNRFPID